MFSFELNKSKCLCFVWKRINFMIWNLFVPFEEYPMRIRIPMICIHSTWYLTKHIHRSMSIRYLSEMKVEFCKWTYLLSVIWNILSTLQQWWQCLYREEKQAIWACSISSVNSTNDYNEKYQWIWLCRRIQNNEKILWF